MLTPEQINQIVQYRKDNVSIRKISKLMGIDRNTVRSYIKIHQGENQPVGEIHPGENQPVGEIHPGENLPLRKPLKPFFPRPGEKLPFYAVSRKDGSVIIPKGKLTIDGNGFIAEEMDIDDLI